MRTLLPAVVALAAVIGTSVQAQTAPISAAAPAPPATPSAAVEPVETERGSLSLEELSHLNGRQGSRTTTVLTDQDLTATNRGNTITANTVGSGQVNIDGGAFAGFAGVGNFVINSGHNNNLQGALTINVVSP